MQIKSAILALTMLAVCSARAAKPMEVGVIAGATCLTAVPQSDAYRGNTRAGYFFGLWGRINLHSTYYVAPEVLYTGNSYRLTSNAAQSSVVVHPSNIQVPVMMGVKLSPFRLEIGPTFNLWNGCTLSSPVSNGSAQAPPYTILYTRSTLGYMLGAALDIKRISFSARYNGDFSQSSQMIRTGDAPGETIKVAMRTWMIGLSYRF